MTAPRDVPPAKGRASWVVTEEETVAASPATLRGILEENTSAGSLRYNPLVNTFRLYAGWLLAWYFFLYAVAGYQSTRSLPFRLSFFQDFLFSPLLAEISLGVFLFLLLSSLHRAVKGTPLLGIVFALLGGAIIWLFAMNM